MGAISTRPDQTTLAALAGVVVLGGLNAISVKQTVAELDPFWGAGLRFVLAGLLLAGIAVIGRRRFPRGRDLLGPMLYGVTGFALASGLIYPGLRDVQAGTGAVLIALSPLATYGLAIAHRLEAFRVRSFLGAIVALLGIGIVFLDQVSLSVPLGSLALILGGMLCLSEAGVIVKLIPRSDPIATNAVAMLTAAALLVPAAIVTGESLALPALASTWLAVAYIVILGSVVLFSLYLVGLERWTASGMSYSTLLLPFVSVAVATVLTGERFSGAFAIGGIVMLAGVYIGAFGADRPHRSTATSMPECLPVADCADAVPGSLRSAADPS